jgi:two-component system, NarL family, invasion response regulator UvrY
MHYLCGIIRLLLSFSTYSMKNDPKVLIIEDHDIVAAALELVLIEQFSKATCQKSVSFPRGLQILSMSPDFDLIILDIDVPGGDSLRMIDRLRAIQPHVRILIFTGQEEQRHAIRYLKAGANGFLSKSAPLENCGEAIRLLLHDKKYVSEAIQQLITDSFFDKNPPGETTRENVLSPRETEVLELLMQGKWTKEIANELNLNPTTVSTHKANIFQKMEVTNVIDLFKKLNKE